MTIDRAALLRERGIQVTAQRLAVLRAVAGRAAHYGRRRGRRRQDRDRRHLAAIGVRRAGPAGRRGAHPAHSALWIAGSLRRSRRRQSPPLDLSNLRTRRRRRLRDRLRAVSHGRSTIGATRSTRPRSPTGVAARIVSKQSRTASRPPTADRRTLRSANDRTREGPDQFTHEERANFAE